MEKSLQAIGLTTNESKIYLSLLETGFASVNTLTKETGFHRRNIYDALQRMGEKGLVSSVELNNVKHFEAAHPKQLLSILKEKESGLLNNFPQLELMYGQRKVKSEVKVFKGVQGIRNLFDDLIDSLDEGDDYYLMGALDMPSYIGPHVEKFHKRRIEKGIIANDIFIVPERAQKVAKMPLTNIKLLPKEYHPPVQINIYKDKVHQIIFSKELLGIQIQNKDIADSFKIYFDFLWKIGKKIK